LTMKLMYITNAPEIAKIAEKSGVDWIFIDLEINGKEKRQEGMNTVISRHTFEDVRAVKECLTSSSLLVRVNPLFNGSEKEIDTVIANGADIVMLPYFKSRSEVSLFIKMVNGRAKTCLLLETAEAVEKIDSILSVDGIDYVHIGLNDLHLSYNLKFMFEPLADGTVDLLCGRMKEKGLVYGFGGIAQIGKGMLPAENILAEHYRLGSSMAILSRSFCNAINEDDLEKIEHLFTDGVARIRKYEREIARQDQVFFKTNRKVVSEKVAAISRSLQVKLVQQPAVNQK